MVARDIIAIGASAGGFEAIQTLASRLPADLDAAVFITLHQYERNEGLLPQALNRFGPLPASHPWEETAIEMGRIYVAPPDYHLILGPETVHLGHGPRENLQRPCINTMFRSAAANHGERVAGVLLTGLLDDGAAGLWDIQQGGGATIVQDPEEAAFPSMPESAIRGLNVQYIVRVAEMAPLLTRLTMGERARSVPTTIEGTAGQLTSQACPECGGAMRLRHKGRIHEYACHTGHRFSLKTIIAEKSSVVERALMTALSQSEELLQLLQEAQVDLDVDAPARLSDEIAKRRKEQDTIRNLVEHEQSSPLG